MKIPYYPLNRGVAALLLILFNPAIPCSAQTDYTLALDANPWLSSAGGATLTTFSGPNVTMGGIAFSHTRNAPLDTPCGSPRNSVGASVQGLFRLSPATVVAGGIAYNYAVQNDASHVFSPPSHASSLLAHAAAWPVVPLPPFDIVIAAPAKANTEAIALHAAFGWQAAPRLSLGAKAEYTTSAAARQKDLRYALFSMDLAASTGLCLHLDACTLAASLHYRRTIHDIAFSRAGTTDAVHVSLIDYAGGLGVSETFSGDGFTDDTPQPLFSRYLGASAQLNVPLTGALSLFVGGIYAHRSGFYGRESQYTIKHATHSSHCYGLHTRLTLKAPRSLHVLDARVDFENLTNRRTNYLSETVDGVTRYTYYDPTPTAAKVQAAARVQYISRFAAWRISVGTDIIHRRRTAWVFPQSLTATHTHCLPFASLQRGFALKARASLLAKVALSPIGIECGLGASF